MINVCDQSGSYFVIVSFTVTLVPTEIKSTETGPSLHCSRKDQPTWKLLCMREQRFSLQQKKKALSFATSTTS